MLRSRAVLEFHIETRIIVTLITSSPFTSIFNKIVNK